MASNRVVIRAAVPGDINDLMVIEQASFVDPWSRETIASSLEEERTFVLVAVESGVICGYGVAWALGDEGDIMHIAVAPAARRRGIGTHLLKELLGACVKHGATKVLLEVSVGNHAARNLYERLGFVEVGLRRRYYRDGEDAVTMCWDASV